MHYLLRSGLCEYKNFPPKGYILLAMLKTNPHMLVVTRLLGGHPLFTFTQLTTPNRCPHRKTCEEEPVPNQQEEANTCHNPLYIFKNPFDSLRAQVNVSLTMHLEERNHDLEKLFLQKEEKTHL